MKCPFCGNIEDKVIDSRSSKEDMVIRRRRECLSCNHRFTTYERIEEVLSMVVKRSGEREPFDKNKIRRSLLTSCQKRNINSDQIDEVIKNVEFAVQEQDKKEIHSLFIGEQVMKQLKKLDKVAYIRFASVYKDFKDPDDFIEQVAELGKE